MKLYHRHILMCFWVVNGLFAQDSLQTVTAEPGDGIYSLLRKNKLSPSLHFNAFIALNKEKINSDSTLIANASYVLPRDKERKKHSIFGEKFEFLDPVSNHLEDTIFYLVSGHGGPDPGALAKYGDKMVAEDEYAYDVTLRLARELVLHGAKVHLIVQDLNDGIRDERLLKVDYDETVYPNKTIPLNQLERLKQRTQAVNQLYKKHKGKYQRLLVTHVDSRARGTNIDVFFYYHQKSKNGQRLAKNIHRTFQRKYAEFQPNRKYTGTFSERSSLYMVKNTLPAMTYIEIGNIRNKKDQRRILNPDNRQALAKWIAEGILLDYQMATSKPTK